MNRHLGKTFRVFAAGLLILLFSGCISRFSPDAGDLTLKNLELGIAFPPVQTAPQTADTVKTMRDLGLTRVRIGCDWSLREPERDRFYWEPLAYRLEQFYQADISVLLSLETHAWPAWLPEDAEHDDPETLEEFREFTRELLRLYGGKIDKIQVGNEWNWEIDRFFNGDEEAYIAYTVILAREVEAFRQETGQAGPVIVLGSFSARHALAFDQGLIRGIRMEGVPVYQESTAAYSRLPGDERISPRVRKVLAGSSYEMLDIHFYDDWQDWPLHLQAFQSAVFQATGRTGVPVLVSEFGGPYPQGLYGLFGPPRDSLLALRLPDYVRTLDALPVREAYFFKLRQGNTDIEHLDSFLVNRMGLRTPAYRVMKGFSPADSR